MNGDNGRHDHMVLVVAYLHAQGYPNNQAVLLLQERGYQIGEPAYSGYLAEAKRLGLVIIKVNPDVFTGDVVEAMQMLTSPDPHLAPALKTLAPANTLKHLWIFYSGQEGTTPESWDTRLAHWAPLAARCVLALLERAEIVGLGWGHTTAACVTALTRDGSGVARRAKQKPLRFVPTCGMPLGVKRRPEHASSALVKTLHTMWGSRGNPLSLENVYAVLPVEPVYKKIVHAQVLARIDDYQTIFGPAAQADAVPLADQLDTLITSVGSLSQGWQTYTNELITVGGISTEELRAVAVGDINGVLMPKSILTGGPLTASQEEEFNVMAGAWTGLTLQQCQRIARQAAHSERPGVIVVAIGASKKEIVLEVVQRGLVNELIIDHDLARALGTMSTVRTAQVHAASRMSHP